VKIAKVVGNVVATLKHPTHYGLKLMKVVLTDEQGSFSGRQIIAADYACAGEDDYVLVIEEGCASRMIAQNNQLAVDAVIVGIIDDITSVQGDLKKVKEGVCDE
jgi:microcompartment protein CcmK/EutM